MTINTNLLIAAPMLQDYLVDKDTGLPLTNGIITLYKDNARSFLKNWYYQTGTPGAYTWNQLPNPLHLSSAGTIQDPNGNDVIPFYYPYDEDDETVQEAYYITVYSVDSNGDPAVLQFTRENFPFNPITPSAQVSNQTLRNYIINNVYWRNCGAQALTSVTDLVIAPSQHDGYTNGDIRFVKDITGANDNLSFVAMTTTLNNDVTPEYYLDMQCSGIQVGETVKCIQYPISLHVNTLKNQAFTLKFYAQNIGGGANNYVDLYIYQYTGTGALSASTLSPIGIGRITLNSIMQEYTVSDIFPDAATNLGAGGDDAFFLRIQYPLAATFHIGHTKPQLFLGTDVANNDFDTYDQIEAIINSPRTGDYKQSLNTFQPYGYLLCNDGVISNSGSITPPANVHVARANIDTWPLYNLLWGLNAAVCPIYDSAGAGTTRGASAIADWSANKQIQLSLALGRSLLGLPPAIGATYDRATTPAWSSQAGVFTVSNNSLLYVGAPVYLSGTMPTGGNFTAGTLYYAIPARDGSSTATLQLASSYDNAIAGTAIAAGAASDNGSNIVMNFSMGGFFGQSRHVQTVNELVAHTHTYGITNAAGVLYQGGNPYGDGTATTSSTGNSWPANIIQPSAYANLFIKL